VWRLSLSSPRSLGFVSPHLFSELHCLRHIISPTLTTRSAPAITTCTLYRAQEPFLQLHTHELPVWPRTKNKCGSHHLRIAPINVRTNVGSSTRLHSHTLRAAFSSAVITSRSQPPRGRCIFFLLGESSCSPPSHDSRPALGVDISKHAACARKAHTFPLPASKGEETPSTLSSPGIRELPPK
jgi:hypothetical protein